MSRDAVTAKIVAAKVAKNISWAKVAKHVGQSKEWTTAACLGQMTLTAAQAKAVGKLFDLSAEDILWLQRAPYKGSLPTAIPSDPLIYRFYELVNVYGTTLKELIHEEFGDGIMSAIDFSMDLTREPDPKGDRVHIVMSGKFCRTRPTDRSCADRARRCASPAQPGAGVRTGGCPRRQTGPSNSAGHRWAPRHSRLRRTEYSLRLRYVNY